MKSRTEHPCKLFLLSALSALAVIGAIAVEWPENRIKEEGQNKVVGVENQLFDQKAIMFTTMKPSLRLPRDRMKSPFEAVPNSRSHRSVKKNRRKYNGPLHRQGRR